MTKFCDHNYSGIDRLEVDCDSCTLERGRVVGFIQAEKERDEVRAFLDRPIRRFNGGVKLETGWHTYSMKGQQLD